MKRFAIALIAASLSLASASPGRVRRMGAAPVDGYRVVHTYAHDPAAFTQGLIYRDGFLFESTGLNGRSSLRKVALDTGVVIQQRPVAQEYFAEGLTDWNDRLIQITWQNEIALVYDRATLAPVRTFSYAGQGWGLTHDARALIMSDGSDTLRFFDPASFREVRRISVRDGDAPVRNLNELEYVRGEIYANVWHSDQIARIAPDSGRVLGWIDLRGIISPVLLADHEAVLNGIAYDAAADRLFVTGKLWPKIFEIQVVRGAS
jgi:glutamine cyclotransferase